jgi:hypothetical protein
MLCLDFFEIGSILFAAGCAPFLSVQLNQRIELADDFFHSKRTNSSASLPFKVRTAVRLRQKSLQREVRYKTIVFGVGGEKVQAVN